MILVVADGEALPARELKALARASYSIALDGAVECFKNMGKRPDLVLGDFDTAQPSTLRWCERRGSLLLPSSDQNSTDLEKALAWCEAADGEAVTVVQALGGPRLDHSLCNLSALKKFHRKDRPLRLLDWKMTAAFVENQRIRLLGKKGKRLGLIPFPSCRVSSQGLEFEMKRTELQLGGALSVSNRVIRASARIEVRGSALLLEER